MLRAIGVGSAALALTGVGYGLSADAVGRAVRPPMEQFALDGAGVQKLLPTGSHVGARIERPTTIYAVPGGKAVAKLGRRTPYGGRQVLSVVYSRPGWVAVLHQSRPNGRVGWVRFRDIALVHEPYTIVIDRSARTAWLRRYGKTTLRFRVSVGRSTSPTPLGRFAVTDRLAMPKGGVYGCCALAITARQRYLPSGWNGGDRVAMHGSPDDGVGAASSSGCVRIRNADLVKLMRVVPIGTRVTIRR